MNSFFKNKDAIALAFLIGSGSLNYVLRDGVGLAPRSLAFTMIFTYGLIFFFLPFQNLKKLYYSNPFLLQFTLFYFIFTLCYIIIYPHEYASRKIMFYDFAVMCIITGVILYLCTLSNLTLNKNFVIAVTVLSFIGSVGLLAFFINKPELLLSKRLALSFGDNSEVDQMGNPHIFGRNAFLGFVGATLLIKYAKFNLSKLIYLGIGVVLFAVVMLSQAMSSILATLLFCFIFFLANFRLKSAQQFVYKYSLTWYGILFMLLFTVFSVKVYQKNQKLIDFATSRVTNRLDSIINSLTGVEATRSFSRYQPFADASASGRVDLLGKVYNGFLDNLDDGNYQKILFGNGYNALYVDVPIVESFNSFGLLGFFLFGTLFFFLSKASFFEIIRPTSIFNQFLAYIFIYGFVYTFTNGLIIDNIRWGIFILIARFLPPYKNLSLETK